MDEELLYSKNNICLSILHRDGCIQRIRFTSVHKSGSIPCSKQAERIIREFDEYFAGKRFEFELDYRFETGSFQKEILLELLKIPYAGTISYTELARRIGNPKAIRAVANALATNPLPILIPCHRVLGKDGALKGYAGGIVAKRQLLELEKGAGL
ncbi:MAG: methylated-DNA--[protein]-cysteine S-methyltransferase [Candidatus Cloacimonetes bacterium]|nr:methylated-DNA--[protein]-cysteine S-methyltransferase [Candidatus Cloacimonadota bacterium]